MYDNRIDIDLRQSNNFLRKVFLYMALGIFITLAITTYLMFTRPAFLYYVFKYFAILMIVEVGMVFSLSLGINKISSGVARILFLVYSAINGLTLTAVGFMYDELSILYALTITFVIFVVTAIFGYTTQEDLSKYRRFFMIGLISLIIMGLINMFLGVGPLYWIQTIVGVVIFSGLIAFDVNRIKNMAYQISYENGEAVDKLGIIGALQLYLDFINLFLYILRIFGRKK